jgi:PAS domain S-box-containing protein
LFQAVIDGSTAVIYAKDLAGRYLLINRRHEALFQVPRDQIKGKTDYDLISKEQADLVRANDEAVLHAGAPIEWEEVVSANGEPRTYISLKFPLFDSSGKPYAVAGISTDITDRKRTEEHLRESEERYRMLVGSVRDHGLLILDPAGYVVSWNTGAESITGHRAEEVIGRNIAEFYAPEDVASGAPKRELAEAAERGRAEHEGWRVRKNGSRVWGHIITTALRDEEGNLLGFARVLREGWDEKDHTSEVRVAQQSIELSPPIIAESPAMRQVLNFVRRVAASEASTILMEGENGTGKDLVAKILHYESRRQPEPFIAINCAAIPETLLESELFGYEKGAFTDARIQKRGVLELAHRGTLFLDEVGELPHVLQAKLLRVLEDQCFRRLGGLKDIQVDLRVIAATNRDLIEAMKRGVFREDLYFRLNVIRIEIPPLRARQDDILPLANFFIQHFNRKFKRQIEGVSSEAAKSLLAHPWPGNVRELRNAIERAMILEDSPLLTRSSLPLAVTESTQTLAIPTPEGVPQAAEESLSLSDSERSLVSQAMEKAGANQTLAAKLLHISRDALRYRLKKFGLL